jgi:hypothetical protein
MALSGKTPGKSLSWSSIYKRLIKKTSLEKEQQSGKTTKTKEVVLQLTLKAFPVSSQTGGILYEYYRQ